MKKLIRWLDLHFEDSIEITLFIFLLINVLIEVFRRYVLHDSNEYSEEIAKYTLIAMVYLGVPYAVRHKRHIVCDVLPSWVSQRTQLVITILSTVLFMVACVFMTLSCWELVQQQIMVGKKTQAMYLPMWWFTSFVGIGFALGFLRLIQALWMDIDRYRKTGIIHEYQIPEE